MDIIKAFGVNVKYYRQAIGLSQEACAEKCGLHRTYISAIERFRRSISIMESLAFFLFFLTFFYSHSNFSFVMLY